METKPYAIKIKEAAVTNITAWWHSSISVNRSAAGVELIGGRRSFWSLIERRCDKKFVVDVNLHNYCCSPASQCPVCLTHVTVLLLSFPVLHLVLPALWLSCLSFLTEDVPPFNPPVIRCYSDTHNISIDVICAELSFKASSPLLCLCLYLSEMFAGFPCGLAEQAHNATHIKSVWI